MKKLAPASTVTNSDLTDPRREITCCEVLHPARPKHPAYPAPDNSLAHYNGSGHMPAPYLDTFSPNNACLVSYEAKLLLCRYILPQSAKKRTVIIAPTETFVVTIDDTPQAVNENLNIQAFAHRSACQTLFTAIGSPCMRFRIVRLVRSITSPAN
ncbi:hypothetical protein A9B99_18960 [Mangrovibacter phragmitis]|uniref:Uncharacterized protein n=1 Tax=Mangrovibacter phragmitis TaxID=1691903 RepID=A0A1B7L6Q5_9ENTR|nr:hypothetical protein A9B99_18960 [Mangrovibacter phragmitis]